MTIIDKIIEFESLDDDSLLTIIKNRLSQIKNKCAFSFSYSDSACCFLLSKCDKSSGGRGALKAVEEYIEEPVCRLLLESDICGVNIDDNGKDIEITGIKSLDKSVALEYN